jgi:hypothetical protein
MARDYENLHDIEDLGDDELRELVRSRLAEHNGLDIDDLSISVSEGVIVLAGRVGTEGERRIAEHVVTDQLGIVSVRNDIVVDSLRRASEPEAMDDHLASQERTAGLQLGDMPPLQSDEAAEMQDSAADAEQRSFGATDIGEVVAGGIPWIPPESPTQEGLGGTDTDRGARGEDH